MVKHIWKMIWNQRSSNGWIFMELLLVFGALWVMMDSMLVSWYIYRQPFGLPTGLAVGDLGRGRLDPFGGEHPPGGGGGRDLRGEFFLSLHLVQ